MSINVALGKILVIEDNRDSRDILAKLLRMSGYDVMSANDGEAGLATALQQNPDLIITDIHMPNMNGIEFVQRVRKNQTLDKVPVLVVTAFGAQVAREAVNAGADAAAEKPFDFDRFLLTVEELIGRSRTSQAIKPSL
jgi:DNA-binding response OmpR family regulator